MRWGATEKEPKLGDTKCKAVFAWLPTRCILEQDTFHKKNPRTCVVWLEDYYQMYRYEEYSYWVWIGNEGDGETIKKKKWFKKESVTFRFQHD